MTQLPLTKQQNEFVTQYLLDANQSRAATASGYTHRQAGRVMSIPQVKKEIALRQTARVKALKINPSDVLKRLVEFTEANLADITNANGTIKSVHEWPTIFRTGLVSDIKVVQSPDGTITTTVKLLDRLKVTELMGRHVDVNVWRDKLDVSVNNMVTVSIKDLTGVIDAEHTLIEPTDDSTDEDPPKA